MTPKPMLYVVKKYIAATTAGEAIRKEKQTPVHEVWMEEDYKIVNLVKMVGLPEEEQPEEE